MKDDPPIDARCRDKFLVQSVSIPVEQDVGSITSIVSVRTAKIRAMIDELSGKTLRKQPKAQSKSERSGSLSCPATTL